MSSSIDEWIGTEVERAFAGEPPLRDPREYAARGRRAQRRRRAGAAGAGLAMAAAVTVLAVGGSQLTAGGDRGVEPGSSHAVKVTSPVPVDPGTAAKCRAGTLGACGQPGIGWDDIHLDARGDIVRGYPGIHVTGYYDHVLTDAYGTSAALEVTADGETVWILLTATRSGSVSGFQSDLPDPDRTFDEWVHDSVDSGRWFSYTPDSDGPGEGVTPQ
jgi:hypothetical protein